jgi:hypothetical protein
MASGPRKPPVPEGESSSPLEIAGFGSASYVLPANGVLSRAPHVGRGAWGKSPRMSPWEAEPPGMMTLGSVPLGILVVCPMNHTRECRHGARGTCPGLETCITCRRHGSLCPVHKLPLSSGVEAPAIDGTCLRRPRR